MILSGIECYLTVLITISTVLVNFIQYFNQIYSSQKHFITIIEEPYQVMNRPRKSKKCPGCGLFIYGDNKSLLRHMISRTKCKKKIVICLGCNKQFVDMIHLKNHQKAQQSSSVGSNFCIQGFDKLKHIQSLTLNLPIFNNTHSNSNNMRHSFSVEQPDHGSTRNTHQLTIIYYHLKLIVEIKIFNITSHMVFLTNLYQT